MPPESLANSVRFHAAMVRWFSELTHQGMFATDSELRVIVWNRWMEAHDGRAASAIVGRSLLDLYPDLVARGLDHNYREALAGRISVISQGLHHHVLPFPATHPELESAEMPQSARVGPLVDGESIIGTITTLEDVSDRLASEHELRKQIEVQMLARATAEQALRAKDEFLSTLSHEMRNPLNAVIGWTRTLTDRPTLDPDLLTRALRVIDRNASAQIRMIDDLLDVARIAAGKLRLELQPVDVPAVALAAVDVIMPTAKAKRIDVRTSLDPTTPRVLGDPQRLQQIIWNLLSNGVKFTEPGGRIDLRVRPEGGAMRLVVSDTGHGISPEFLPFVFERFRQSDASSARRFGGLGLGLALVRELVDLHGGTVRADSEGEGKGATFTVELPGMRLSETTGEEEPRLRATDDAPSLREIRVLVVEDEADSRELLVETLSASGAEVVAVASCQEALAELRQASGRRPPHVIVSDLGMPKEDGYDLIRQVRALPEAEGGRIPAIALTGYANPEDRRRALVAGYHGHVAKPMDRLAVIAAIRRAALDGGFRPNSPQI
jgi:signal transduction histidine kinase/ActR/RegA family two-component response regulator